ncbi:uncharacterized protein LOC119591694 [Penaeus monodon]|uniref:uncharacterized protein LOC119591694 n=1 Tax=Penaeus monodon TaxID=6687 RepID=UPI0018A715A3|nr:uncharacterized protein LOC119591694 [Penaeus monodon]
MEYNITREWFTSSVINCLRENNFTLDCFPKNHYQEFDFGNWLQYVQEMKNKVVIALWACLVTFLTLYSIYKFSMCIGDFRSYDGRLFCCRICGNWDDEVAAAAAAAAAAGAASNNASQTAPVQQICVVPNESDGNDWETRAE